MSINSGIFKLSAPEAFSQRSGESPVGGSVSGQDTVKTAVCIAQARSGVEETPVPTEPAGTSSGRPLSHMLSLCLSLSPTFWEFIGSGQIHSHCPITHMAADLWLLCIMQVVMTWSG